MSGDEIKGLHDRLDRIEQITLLGVKEVLDIDEAALFTGYSKGFLYRNTSERTIPHYKKNNKLLFKKSELERWLCGRKVLSKEEINSRADTYTAIYKLKQ